MRKKYGKKLIKKEVDKLSYNIVSNSEDFEAMMLVHGNSSKSSPYQWIAGIGEKSAVSPASHSFEELREFYNVHKDWVFGHFSYDLKNQLEKLSSENPDKLRFPQLYFFVPEIVLYCNENYLTVEYEKTHIDEPGIEKLLEGLLQRRGGDSSPGELGVPLKAGMDREEYLSAVKTLKEHIRFGNIYEVNFCQHYFADNININPGSTWIELNKKTKAPFSTFYKSGKNYLLCASPERYIRKTGNKVYSQPMKGTIRRGVDPDEDRRLVNDLKNDPKEKSENVMITDLVRNDLSKFALKKSVKVEELFGVYTFKTVHQMISTVSAEVNDDLHWVDMIKSTFPMGSMTGAPKVRAMELIEEQENFRRGLYSGSVGYVTPEGDFDFNVVIRSILYNSNLSTLALMAGGAITSGSVPEKEYDESLLKLKALADVLQARL